MRFLDFARNDNYNMIKVKFIISILFIVIVGLFSYQFILHGKLPIPSDTIIGLYHPFRDLYAKEFPNGIPYKNFLITDPVRQQYPWRFFAISVEKMGQLPLWNPYNFGGTPLLANFQTAAFYPLNILLFIFPFAIGWSILILLQPIFAGIFLYFYLRNLRLSALSSFFGGVVFAFCGFSTAWLEWGIIGNTALWLPLVLLSIDKLFYSSLGGSRSNRETKQSPREKNHEIASAISLKALWLRNDVKIWFVIFILSLVFSFFAGHIQIFFYLVILSFLYFLARWIQFGEKKNILILFSLLIFCFLLLTCIQWLPTVQFILQSARNADQLNAWQQSGWFIPWQHLIQFVAPDFFGNPATLNYWGTWNYGELVGYVGIAPLIFALFGMFFRKDRKTLFFGTIFFLSLIFALPTIFAQLPFIWNLPFLSTSQPTRLLFLTDFSLSILASLGFDYYFREEKKLKIFYPVLFIGLVFAILWFYVLKGFTYTIPISPANLSVAKHNLLFPTILFFISACLLVFYSWIARGKYMSRRLPYIVGSLFILIVLFDLLRFSWKFNPFTDPNYLFPQTQALAYLQKQPGQYRIMETDSQILPPNFSVMYHLQDLSGYDPLYLQRYGELMVAIGRNKPDIHTPFGFNRIITPTSVDSRLIDLSGVKYILSLSDLHDAKLQKVFTEGQTRVYENTKAFPRAFLVTNIKTVTDKQEAIAALFDPKTNLHNTAIVEGWDSSKKNFTNGSASITNYQANLVSITTKSSDGSFLVLTDTFYPTWQVTVDGKESHIYRTDYNFRGVYIPKGKHEIIFSEQLF